MNTILLGTDIYLKPTYFIDSDHPAVIEFAHQVTKGLQGDKEKAIALYYAVRDGWRYNPYNISLKHEALRASDLLLRPSKAGYCTEKACLFNALLRVVGIPSRFHFFDVRNHIGVEKFIQIVKTDVLAFHSCSEAFIDGKWVKATPAFNKELCEHLGVETLEFDGVTDSVFQEYDQKGGTFMEYLTDYGAFHDMPHDMFVMVLKRTYPHFFETQEAQAMMR